MVTRKLIEDEGVQDLEGALRNVAGVSVGGYYNEWDSLSPGRPVFLRPPVHPPMRSAADRPFLIVRRKLAEARAFG